MVPILVFRFFEKNSVLKHAPCSTYYNYAITLYLPLYLPSTEPNNSHQLSIFFGTVASDPIEKDRSYQTGITNEIL
jgi:hypothetical protein